VGEITGLRLASLHSLHFYMSLMQEIREAISHGNFAQWKVTFLEGYASEDKVFWEGRIES
jgi:queuine tRNA-ribosyltransferase